MYILNVINEKKRVLNKERNNTYLAEASIFPTLYHYMLIKWREISPKSLPPGNKGSTQHIRWFLKTHYNHHLKINITAKRSYQLKIIKLFFLAAGVVGGWGYWGNFPVGVLINSFIYLFIFIYF